jgi:WS/DGAT/MGAT family acyltransferase
MTTEAQAHRLSSADTAWLHMDRPINLMVINAVMLFDERLAEERLREVLRKRLVERYPRFHERIVERRLPLLGPSFEDDPKFALEHHLYHLALPQPGDEATLRKQVGDLIVTPLDRAKPLWEAHLLDRPEGGSALLLRMHHCIADGIALARVMLSLTDAAPAEDGFLAAAAADRHPPRDRARGRIAGAIGAIGAPFADVAALAGSTIAATRGASSALGREGIELLAHPSHARELLDRTASDARALAKLLFSSADADTGLRGRLSVSKKVAWTEQLELVRVKAIAHAQGATVNDVLLASVTGALRRHLRESGEQPLAIRTLVPYNLRALQEPIPRELGNRFGLVFLTLPVDVAGRRARLLELKRRMDAIKHSPEGPISYAILEGVGLTPPLLERRIVDIFTAKASAVMTNVPGPREVVYLAGTPVRAVLVWAPTSGSVGMSVSIFSYRGEVTIGLLVDAGLVADPQLIMRRTEQELAALGRLKPVAGARAKAAR